MVEIGKVWQDMNDMSKAALLEILAGKQRSSVVAALLNDADLLEQVYNSAMNSAGSATHELDVYLSSIQGHLDKFTNAVQTMWMNAINSDAVKFFVDCGTAVMNFIDKVGLLNTALVALVGYIVARVKFGGILNALGLLGTKLTSISEIIASLKHALSDTSGFAATIKEGKTFNGMLLNTIELLGLSDTAFGKYIASVMATATTEVAATGATGTLSVAFITLKVAILQAAAALKAFALAHPIIAAIVAIAAGITAAVVAIDALTTSHKEYVEQLKDTNQELEDIRSNIDSLNSELETTKERIKELENKGPLSFTEEEELKRLKAQNDELERSIRLEEEKERREQTELAKDFNQAYESDDNFKTTQYKAEPVGGHIVTSTTEGPSKYDANVNALESETKHLEELKKQREELGDVSSEAEKKQSKELDKQIEQSENRIESLNATLDEAEKEYEDYADLPYFEGDDLTDAQKKFNENKRDYENKRDRRAIINGESGAKADAFERIFGVNGAEGAEEFIDEVQKKLDEDKELLDLQVKLETDQKSLSDARKNLADLQDEADKIGVDLDKTEYGNIDLNNRQILTWNKENLNKYQKELESMYSDMSWDQIIDELEGSISTVLGSWDTFEGVDIAFTPILQTDDGPVLLSADTTNQYINGLIQKAKANGKEPTYEVLMELDKEGMEVDGQQIKNILADVGETAEKTAESMHFGGKDGAIAQAEKDVESLESIVNDSLNKIGLHIQSIIEKYPGVAAALKATGLDLQGLAGWLTQTGEYAEQASEDISTYVNTIDTLTSSIESYKSALETVNSITFDGQAISEDYYNTLKTQLSDITVAEEGFSDAIQEQNGKYIVKNVSLLNKLVAQSKKAQKATIQVAKAQAQTQYKDLVKQIRNNVIYMAAECQAYGYVSQATLDNISVMRQQLEALKETIHQYALLELSMSDAANAFDEYEQAKERDAQLTYDDSMLEMLKTIDEGILNNETGTEAFEFAVKAIVPEEFWKDIDDVDEKIRSIHDYIDGDNVFSRFFHIDEESGDLDITTDNVREFVDMCIDKGLFDGDSKDFALNKSVEGVKDFADALGVTEPVLLAMLSALEKVDAKWGDILTDVTTKPLDREINSAVDEVDVATEAMEDFWKAAAASGEFDPEEYQKLCANLDSANSKLETAEKNAQKNAQEYNTLSSAINSFRGNLNLTDEDAQGLVDSLKQIEGLENLGEVKIEDGQLKLTDEQIKLILQKLGLLEEPSVMQVQLRYDDIVAQIDALNQYIEEGCKGEITIDGVVIKNEQEAKAKLSELQPEKKNIEYTYNITETSTDAEKSVLESYQELAKNGLEFTVTSDVTAAKQSLKEVQDEKVDDKSFEITADNSTALQAINNVIDKLAEIKDKNVTITVTEKKSIFETISSIFNGNKDSDSGGSGALGNAFASGNIGLKQSANNVVVGELGTEMVVDAAKGVYYTVGENGTEMIDLPKGAIIYNHKQTAELLKHGRTSRGTPTSGLSFAHGNAYAGYGIPSYHPNTEDKTSFANGSKINQKWDDAASSLLDSADALADASDSASDAFEDTINWIEVLFTRIDNILSEHEAYLATVVDSTGGLNEKNSIYSTMFGQMYYKANKSLEAANYYRNLAEKEMAGLDEDTKSRIRNGMISIQEFKGTGDETADKALEERVNKINQAIEYYNEISTYTQQYYSTIEEIADKALEHQEEVATAYENEIGLVEHLNNTLEARNDLEEAKEGFATETYYKAQIDAQNKMLSMYQAERVELQRVLDEEVALGRVKIGSQQWFDMQQAIYDVDDTIIDTEASIEDLQNSINDLYWDRFDELINRFGYLEDEISNVIQLLSHDPDGLIMEELRDLTTTNWATGSGLATLGLYAQQMEEAQYVANQYAEQIKELKKQYAAGRYNETEYLNKLNELTSSMYENIEKYHDAKDAVVELNEARVDAIKDGIEKEIDAYDELIQKKKELLNREQD